MESHEKVFGFYDSGCKVEILPIIYMVGMVFPYAGTTVPKGFLICDGRQINRKDYENLFRVIGTTYGSGDGSTTFNVPNLKGRVPIGLDDNDVDFNALGKKGGEKKHTLTDDEIPSHSHSASTTIGNAGAHTHSASASSSGAHTHTVSGTANSSGSHKHSFAMGGWNYPVTGVWAPIAEREGTYSDLVSYPQKKSAWHENAISTTGAHTHSLTGSTNSTGGHTHTITVNSGGSHNHSASTSVGNSGGGKAHNNLQPYIVLNYIIKY